MRRVAGRVRAPGCLLQRRAFSPGVFYGLTDEQRSFVDMAKDFAVKELPLDRVGAWDRDKTFPAETLRKMADQGFAAIYCPPAVGGMGLTRLDASVIFEQLAYADSSTTAYLTIHNMCAWMLSSFGAPTSTFIREEIAPKVCTMECFASYCLTEPASGSDAAALRTTAVTDESGDFYVVNGSKAFISGAGTSDVYVTMVRTDPSDKSSRGVSCVCILKSDPGVSFGKNELKLGWNSQPTRTVQFDNVRIPKKDRLIGKEGEGFKIAMKGLDGGRVNIASSSLGAAQRCLDLAVAYTKERHQFNQPIANFQNTQFQLAEMAAKVHTSRLLVRQAAASVDDRDPNATQYCAMAKLVATDECFTVADRALQLHGGYGYLNDFPVERFLRDLRVHRILEGTNEVMRMIVARALLQP